MAAVLNIDADVNQIIHNNCGQSKKLAAFMV